MSHSKIKYKKDESTLDELFQRSRNFRTSAMFIKFLDFTGKITKYSAYNSGLAFLQNPDVSYYATPNKWSK